MAPSPELPKEPSVFDAARDNFLSEAQIGKKDLKPRSRTFRVMRGIRRFLDSFPGRRETLNARSQERVRDDKRSGELVGQQTAVIDKAEGEAEALAAQLAEKERTRKAIEEQLALQLAEAQRLYAEQHPPDNDQIVFKRGNRPAPLRVDSMGRALPEEAPPVIVGNPNPQFIEQGQEDPAETEDTVKQAAAAPIEAPAELKAVIAPETAETAESPEQKQYNKLAELIRRVNPLRKDNAKVAEALEQGNVSRDMRPRVLEAIEGLRSAATNSSWSKENQQLFADVEGKLQGEQAGELQQAHRAKIEAVSDAFRQQHENFNRSEKDRIASEAGALRQKLEGETIAQREALKADKEETIAAFDGLSQVFSKYQAMHPAHYEPLARAFSKDSVVPKTFPEALPEVVSELNISGADLEKGRQAIEDLTKLGNLSAESSKALNRGLARIDHEVNRRQEERKQQEKVMAGSERARVAHMANQDLARSGEAAVRGVREKREAAERATVEKREMELQLDRQAMVDTAKVFEQYRSQHPARYDKLAGEFATGSPSQDEMREGLILVTELLQLNSLSQANRKTLENARSRMEALLPASAAPPVESKKDNEAETTKTSVVRELKRPKKKRKTSARPEQRKIKQPTSKAA